MAKKLVTRSKFAELCGIKPPSVTKACTRVLAPACDGKMIDLAHPAARDYLNAKTAPRPTAPAEGIDPLYEQSLALCRATNRWSARGIAEGLKISNRRASTIMAMLRASGAIAAPAPPTPPPPPPALAPPRRPTPVPTQEPPPTPPDSEGIVEIPEDIQSFADLTIREVITRFGTESRFLDFLNAVQKIEAINEKRLRNAEKEGRLISRDLVKTGILDKIDGVFVQLLTDGTKTISARAHAIAASGGEVDAVRKMVEDQVGSFIRPAKVKMHEALNNA